MLHCQYLNYCYLIWTKSWRDQLSHDANFQTTIVAIVYSCYVISKAAYTDKLL